MKSRSYSPIPSRLQAWFNNLHIQDPVELRVALLLQVLLLGLMALVILATVGLLTVPGLSAREKSGVLTSDLFGFLVVLLPFLLLRRGYFRASALVIIVILIITPTLAITVAFDLANNGGVLFQFTLAIFLSGLLVNRRALTLVFALSAALVAFSAFRMQSAEPRLARLAMDTAVNFILFNGLIALFLDRFGITLRTALTDALARESELQGQISDRREAETRFRLAIESAPNAIIMIDAAGRILVVNSQAETYFGYSRETLIGAGVDSLVPERFRRGHPGFRAGFLSEPQARPMGIGLDLFALRRDGSEFPVEIGLAPIQTPEGTLVMATIVDITERKQAQAVLQESEERYRTLFESIDQGFCTIEVLFDTDEKPVDYRFLVVNPAFERQTGIQNAVGRLMREIAPLHEEHWFQIYGRIALTGESMRFENPADQLHRYYDVYAWKVGLAEERKVAILFNDITQRKRAEERQQFLANASKSLASSLEYETTLTTVAQLAVPKIADWCTVYLTAADGSIEQVALTHADPEKVQWARELQRRFPPNPNAPGGVAQVIRSGKAEFMPEIPAELLEPLRKDPEISRLLDQLQLTGAMTVPLTLHGQTLGAISLVSAESRLRYTPDDLELAEELARRIVVAVENARLYHTARRLNEDLELRVVERTAELSQANALLNAMMDNVPDHIFFKDRESRFLRNSRSQAEMLGLNDPIEVVGKSDFDFFPHARRAFDVEQEIIRSGEPNVDEEEHVVWPDGRETWVSTTKVPLRQQDGEIVGIFGIARDITERKRAEESLKLAKDQVEAANKELEAFSYSVSHDLRAPLRAINGYTRMLLEDYEPLLDEEGKRLFNVVRSEAQRMGELIDDLLTFSRLGRTEIRSLSIDMAGMAQKIFDELTKPETRARIDFHLGNLPPASGDPALIHQVWVNLISNAIKFTSKKDRAVIRVSGTSDGLENIYGVNDNGAGFDLEYGDKLFGVFQRLHSESEFEGTGVGLAIVQRVILRHGGRVWADGEVDRGATFHFSLPRQRGEP